MKKLILVSLLLVSQLASAQREVKRLSVAEAKSRTKNAVEYIEKLRGEGKSILTSPEVRKSVTKAIEEVVNKAAKLDAKQTEGLLKLIDISPADVLPELKRLASIVQAKESSAAEKSQAQKTIELMASADHTVPVSYRSAEQKVAAEAKVKEILQLSEKVAGIASGPLAAKSADFVTKYEKALREGKSLEQAVSEASGGKFSLKELIDCV
jgi:hypothetical protein